MPPRSEALPTGPELDVRARTELGALTGLRFFAAAHVVLYHFAGPLIPAEAPQVLHNFVGHGYVGVTFFYLLSGFILAYSYAERSSDGVVLRGTRSRFFARRIARIYPLYFLAWLLAAPFVFAHRFGGANALGALNADSFLSSALKLLVSAGVSLSLAQAWIPGAGAWWNPPGWSISVEAFFYVAFPWLLPRLLAQRRRYLALFVTLYLASLAPPCLFSLLDGGAILLAVVKYNPLCHLPAFAMGMILAATFDSPFRQHITRYRTWFLGFGAMSAVIVVTRPVDGIYLFVHNGLLAPAFGALLLGFADSPGRVGRLLSSRVLHLLGEASYGIYILQAPLWLAWRELLAVVPSPLSPLAEFAVFFALLCAFSLLAFKGLEAPARRLLRSRFRGA